MEEFSDFIKANTRRDAPMLQREIANHFGCTTRDVRQAVHDARCNGIPICSGQHGYYYSEDAGDVMQTILTMRSKARETDKAADALRRWVECQ